MTKYYITVAVLLLSLAAAPSYANEAERIAHYEAQALASPAEAAAAIESKTSEIAAVLEKEELENTDLEQIHAASYTLEAAIDILYETNSGNAGQIDLSNESIQAIHASSENHNEAELRKWFETLHSIPVSDLYTETPASQ